MESFCHLAEFFGTTQLRLQISVSCFITTLNYYFKTYSLIVFLMFNLIFYLKYKNYENYFCSYTSFSKDDNEFCSNFKCYLLFECYMQNIAELKDKD